jgi:hypothetical protein
MFILKAFGVAVLGLGLYGLGTHAMSGGHFSAAMLMDGVLLAEPLWWLCFGISCVASVAGMAMGIGKEMVRSLVAMFAFLMLAALGSQWRAEDQAIAKFARLHRAAIEAGEPLRVDGLPLAAVPNARVVGHDALLLLGVIDESDGKRSSVDRVKAVCEPKCTKIEVWRGSAVRRVELDAPRP